ncbi:histidinol phosphatase-like enzyme (inositol monophosphatase family) [Mesorhizobium tianshanense]|uniref:Histidinol phosphatase-like enzyme (Inositol monophosphatase family) n=1 Tax=Mesorhizobium tianshanense TaxID=39844 RepID=A0A562NBQ7_9HYPH|nr:inositol monophosphatase family protein [Mesorhizobium tianshanense]TWI29554.1 histidinol phosphatase-like enzyme (inositol monophosphatase family) [Mesorhizobium tianshanense]
MSELDNILNVAIKLAEASSSCAKEAWLGDIAVTYKADGSSLTEADLSIEATWRDRIRQQFPAHGILGEEYGSDTGTSAFTWVLDPIDGTRQFGTGLLNFASLISVCRDGNPIVGIIDLPLIDARYIAAEGRGTMFDGRSVRSSRQREIQTARISLANPESFTGDAAQGYERLRASGRLKVFDGGAPAYGALSRGLIDVCLNGTDLDAYDICALCPVVTEAGGAISDWAGDSLTLASSGAIVACASFELHATVLEMLGQA